MPVLNASTFHSEDDIQGRSRPVVGRYHAAVNSAEETQSKNKGTPGLQIEFQVVCDGLPANGKGTTNGQAGKTISLFLSYMGQDDEKTQTCLSRVTRLALALGVLQPGEAKEVDWGEAIGRELVIEVGEETYTGKGGNEVKSTGVTFMGFWSLGNKQVKDVPKDLKSPGMQALGRGITTSHPGGAPKASDGHTGGQTANGNGTAGNGHANGNGNGSQAAAGGSASKSKYADL